MTRRPLLTLGALLAAGIISLGSGGVLIAQEATPQDMASMAHPVHIHIGSCPEVGEVIQPLGDISAEATNNGTPMAMSGEMMGSQSAIPVESSITTVPLALEDILAGEHAINVHESAENIGNYIACGNIGGMMIGETDLLFGMGPQNDSGYSGVASLHDNGDGTTTVYVYLTMGGMMGGMATPVASPTS